jgi:hypothetical protein
MTFEPLRFEPPHSPFWSGALGLKSFVLLLDFDRQPHKEKDMSPANNSKRSDRLIGKPDRQTATPSSWSALCISSEKWRVCALTDVSLHKLRKISFGDARENR